MILSFQRLIHNQEKEAGDIVVGKYTSLLYLEIPLKADQAAAPFVNSKY